MVATWWQAMQPFGYYQPEIQAKLTKAKANWRAEYVIEPGPQTTLERVEIITALRKGERQMAIGGLLGASLLDASVSIGSGPIIVPNDVTAELAIRGSLLGALVLGVVRGSHQSMAPVSTSRCTPGSIASCSGFGPDRRRPSMDSAASRAAGPRRSGSAWPCSRPCPRWFSRRGA